MKEDEDFSSEEDEETSSPSDEDDDSEEEDLSSYLTDDLSRLHLTNIAATVDRLYRLSFRIRSPAMRIGLSKAIGYTEVDPDTGVDLINEYATVDQVHIVELFRSYGHDVGVGDHFLVNRLAKANTRRRQQFRYWRKRKAKFIAYSKPNDTREEAPKDSDKNDEGHANILLDLNTFNIPHPKLSLPSTATRLGPVNMNWDDDASMISTNTFVMMAGNSKDGDESVSIPAPPDVDDRVKEFECPHCFIVCPRKTLAKKSWETHIFRDLRPYICTYEDCREQDQQYDSLGDWIAHETLKHRGAPGQPGNGQTSIATALPRAQHESVPNPADSTRECPFCRIQGATPVHVAAHLRRIASFALPRWGAEREDGLGAGSNVSGQVEIVSRSSFSVGSSTAKIPWEAWAEDMENRAHGDGEPEQSQRDYVDTMAQLVHNRAQWFSDDSESEEKIGEPPRDVGDGAIDEAESDKEFNMLIPQELRNKRFPSGFVAELRKETRRMVMEPTPLEESEYDRIFKQALAKFLQLSEERGLTDESTPAIEELLSSFCPEGVKAGALNDGNDCQEASVLYHNVARFVGLLKTILERQYERSLKEELKLAPMEVALMNPSLKRMRRMRPNLRTFERDLTDRVTLYTQIFRLRNETRGADSPISGTSSVENLAQIPLPENSEGPAAEPKFDITKPPELARTASDLARENEPFIPYFHNSAAYGCTYGCNRRFFSSEDEWKQHVSTVHPQLIGSENLSEDSGPYVHLELGMPWGRMRNATFSMSFFYELRDMITRTIVEREHTSVEEEMQAKIFRAFLDEVHDILGYRRVQSIILNLFSAAKAELTKHYGDWESEYLACHHTADFVKVIGSFWKNEDLTSDAMHISAQSFIELEIDIRRKVLMMEENRARENLDNEVEEPKSHSLSSQPDATLGTTQPWSAAEDEILLQARTQSLSWFQIQKEHFPNISTTELRRRCAKLLAENLHSDRDNEGSLDAAVEALEDADIRERKRRREMSEKHSASSVSDRVSYRDLDREPHAVVYDEEEYGSPPQPPKRTHWGDGEYRSVDTREYADDEESVRPEKCPITSCEYHSRGFAKYSDMLRHALNHYKGFMVCGFCPQAGTAAEKVFSRTDIFKRHLTDAHSVEKTDPRNRKGGLSLGKRPNHGAAKCSVCDWPFSNPQDFYEHLDDCVFRAIQQEDPCEEINQKLLNEVASDDAVRETLEKHGLDIPTVKAPMIEISRGFVLVEMRSLRGIPKSRERSHSISDKASNDDMATAAVEMPSLRTLNLGNRLKWKMQNMRLPDEFFPSLEKRVSRISSRLDPESPQDKEFQRILDTFIKQWDTSFETHKGPRTPYVIFAIVFDSALELAKEDAASDPIWSPEPFRVSARVMKYMSSTLDEDDPSLATLWELEEALLAHAAMLAKLDKLPRMHREPSPDAEDDTEVSDLVGDDSGGHLLEIFPG